jgi:hypothetical protein
MLKKLIRRYNIDMKENKLFRIRRVPIDYYFQFFPCFGYNTRFMDCININWNCIILGYWQFYFHGKEKITN